MPSTDDYLDRMADGAQPTPRAQGGRVLTLKISLYKPGHAGLDAPGVPLMTNDDAELLRFLELLIAKVRARM
jgi:hypothetical protein